MCTIYAQIPSRDCKLNEMQKCCKAVPKQIPFILQYVLWYSKSLIYLKQNKKINKIKSSEEFLHKTINDINKNIRNFSRWFCSNKNCFVEWQKLKKKSRLSGAFMHCVCLDNVQKWSFKLNPFSTHNFKALHYYNINNVNVTIWKKKMQCNKRF